MGRKSQGWLRCQNATEDEGPLVIDTTMVGDNSVIPEGN